MIQVGRGGDPWVLGTQDDSWVFRQLLRGGVSNGAEKEEGSGKVVGADRGGPTERRARVSSVGRERASHSASLGGREQWETRRVRKGLA